jgi:hypothetical protein
MHAAFQLLSIAAALHGRCSAAAQNTQANEYAGGIARPKMLDKEDHCKSCAILAGRGVFR